MTNQTPQPEETVERTVRHAAGADPQKRQQIMRGPNASLWSAVLMRPV